MILQEDEYTIPEGYSIKKVGHTITIYKSKTNKLTEEDYRCKDCIHYVQGYSLNSGYYPTIVCDKQPKKDSKDGRTLYKAAKKYGKICTYFEHK